MKNKLRTLLADRKIKKGHFANLIGISPGSLSLIVNEKSTPTLKVAMKIAKTLDLKVEDIWDLDDEN